MDTLNLDIDTYTHFDLIQLFSLSTKYTPKQVNDSKNKLINQLKKIQSIGTDKKLNIQMFVDNAASRLMNNEPKSNFTWSQRKNNMVPASNEHYVIEDNNRLVGKQAKTTEGRLGGTDNVPPGWLNPINVRSTHSSINIDSRFRKDYNKTSSSDYSFDLPYIQKKVTNIRIASLDIPMSFYGVSRERGDATFIITTTYESNSITNHPCFNQDNSTEVSSLIDMSDPSRPVFISLDSITSNTIFTYGWLIVLPDGNYEMQWQKTSAAADISIALNNALQSAKPGVLLDGTGKFLLYDISDVTFSSNTTYGIDPTVDLCYLVDQPSGRSIFRIPDSVVDSVPSVFTEGYHIRFATDQGGSLITGVNIQLYLGWQLGFREGGYICQDSTTCISESVCLISGPRTMFISIEDGVKNYGGNLVVAFTESTMPEPIITRINLTQSMNDERVYKIAGDVGLETQLNRIREYFGPVTISKFKFKLLDEYGRIISLNKMDWSIVIVFEKLYD